MPMTEKMLNKVLKMNQEEHDFLELCLLKLDAAEIAACQAEAWRISKAELQEEDIATVFTDTLVKIIVRGVRSARLELRQRKQKAKRRHKKAPTTDAAR